MLFRSQTSGHVVVNPEMTEGTTLEVLCAVAATRRSFSDRILELFSRPLAQEDFLNHRKHIEENYNTKKNCGIIAELIGD